NSSLADARRGKRNALLRIGALLPILSLCAPVANAEDWTQWRGPNRDGICTETGLLKQWPPAGPRLVWKANGLGSGFATVSVVGERIFTTGQSSDSSSVIAINAANGQAVWSAKLGKASSPGGYVGPRSQPTVAGDVVYATGHSGALVGVDA